MKKLEITIPVLNEEKTIKLKINEMINFVENNISNVTVKFIIADNGSTDATERYSLELVDKFENLEYIKLPEKGVGLALRTSWLKSSADYVGYMDLDIATDLEALKIVTSEMEKNTKIINGSRLLKDSIVINRTLLRELSSRIFNMILKLVLKVKFTDGMCGFKFLDRKIAQELIETGKEIPVKWTDDRNSKVKIFSLSLNYLKSIFKLKNEEKEFKEKI